MNYANIFAAICFKTQPKYANICFKTQGKFSVACRILLLREKTPLKEHLLARADTLPYQTKRGNFAIISSFYLIPYFPAYKITTFPPTLQIFDNKVYNSIQKHHRYHCLEKCKETVSKQYPQKCTFLQKSTFLDNIYTNKFELINLFR